MATIFLSYAKHMPLNQFQSIDMTIAALHSAAIQHTHTHVRNGEMHSAEKKTTMQFKHVLTVRERERETHTTVLVPFELMFT